MRTPVKLPDSLRDHMKAPLGVLLPEGSTGTDEIQSHLPKDAYVITVGDRTTERMIGLGIVPSLQIVDGLEKRKKRRPPALCGATEITTDNPAAEITTQSIRAIQTALAMPPPVRLHVNGEEDLLVIPACIHAPANAVVLYGQPDEGLVVVRVSPEIKNRMQALLDMMME